MNHLRAVGIPDLATQYRGTLEKITQYELSALSPLTEAGRLFRAQNSQVNNTGEFEDMHACPLNASLADLGLDQSAFTSSVEEGLVSSTFEHGGGYLGNDFDSAIEQFTYSNM